jgi:hypothetical protein
MFIEAILIVTVIFSLWIVLNNIEKSKTICAVFLPRSEDQLSQRPVWVISFVLLASWVRSAAQGEQAHTSFRLCTLYINKPSFCAREQANSLFYLSAWMNAKALMLHQQCNNVRRVPCLCECVCERERGRT